MAAASSSKSVEETLLQSLAELNIIEDSVVFAESIGQEHQAVVGTIKSLESGGYVVTETTERKGFTLTDEGNQYADAGSPEVQVFAAIPAADGISMDDLNKALGAIAKIGFAQCMQLKWVKMEKAVNKVFRTVESVEDKTKAQLLAVRAGQVESLDAKDLDGLKRRKLVAPSTVKIFKINKGENFSTTRAKASTDLTHEMMASGAWKSASFKQYNFDAVGKPPAGGCLHPLLKVRQQFREIFLELGFEEMPTNNFVESSFWNFDALFQPQQHPARDAHDTFFLKTPAKSEDIPADYLQRVKEIHESGGYGSIGYRYDWKIEEAQKNVLRTHTTAVSSRMLYKLAQDIEKDGFKPKKYFSIDRVFRNEVMDATHLCEFHQIEGVVCDRDLSLGNMMAIFAQFFEKIGIKNLRYKPAFNPYTEPSMEIFGYHPQLKRWVEVGNSGMFRPEMLRPMGLPEDVRVLGWGLSTERPTMILYGLSNIRDLVGHKVDLEMIKSNPLCRLDHDGEH